eukprot:1789391-Lingulodinium_polyedra.AAC.1
MELITSGVLGRALFECSVVRVIAEKASQLIDRRVNEAMCVEKSFTSEAVAELIRTIGHEVANIEGFHLAPNARTITVQYGMVVLQE